MSLAEVALFTDDVTATTRFYRALVGSDPVAEWPGGALFALGAAKILVHARSAAMDGWPPNEDHFAVAVDDLAAACEAMREAGAALLVEPADDPWGRSAYLRDPDGRLVELAQA